MQITKQDSFVVDLLRYNPDFNEKTYQRYVDSTLEGLMQRFNDQRHMELMQQLGLRYYPLDSESPEYKQLVQDAWDRITHLASPPLTLFFAKLAKNYHGVGYMTLVPLVSMMSIYTNQQRWVVGFGIDSLRESFQQSAVMHTCANASSVIKKIIDDSKDLTLYYHNKDVALFVDLEAAAKGHPARVVLHTLIQQGQALMVDTKAFPSVDTFSARWKEYAETEHEYLRNPQHQDFTEAMRKFGWDL